MVHKECRVNGILKELYGVGAASTTSNRICKGNTVIFPIKIKVLASLGQTYLNLGRDRSSLGLGTLLVEGPLGLG
ncbi:hypothetical protein J8TS2_03680 [Lederbergia ruris]|uniref:Uncharacterized protein n=1 Tax=Lederbergia ruris TaxID=217495 RepID=A0ABQ4KG21_9BACI|nr:hypothetical protein J8TS2_03680 [Lederbergia ruris]